MTNTTKHHLTSDSECVKKDKLICIQVQCQLSICPLKAKSSLITDFEWVALTFLQGILVSFRPTWKA